MQSRPRRLTAITAICGCLVTAEARAAEPVTPDTFRRAEYDFNFKKKVDAGMYGKFGHDRVPASIDRQMVVRINRDTL
jgi:hypothetical protein